MSHVLLFTDEDYLREVRSAVVGLAGKWKDLGICLGVRLSELNGILSANPHSPSDCLRETLALWLKQNYNVRTTLILLHDGMLFGDQRVIIDHINSLIS